MVAPAVLWLLLLAASPAPLEVAIVRPPADRALFGEIEIAAEVRAGVSIRRVELRVDGELAGVDSEAPYRFTVDVGQENLEHRIEVMAHGDGGEVASAVLVSPRIRIDDQLDLELQQLYVTVTGGRGRRVLGLDRGRFRIRDEKRRQELITFAHGSIPFTAVLLLDASASMAGERLELALRGAGVFVDGMAENDEVKIMTYSDRLRLATDYSGDAGALRSALSAAEADGGTAILDQLYLALLSLESRQGRRVVILLSDGLDLHSVLDVDELDRLARLSQASVYWVRLVEAGEGGLSRTVLSAWRDPLSSRQIVRRLERIVKRSGGRIDTVADVGSVAASFGSILQELREQYALGYYPDPRRNDGSWRRVRVELEEGGLEVRAREGYIDR